MSVIITTLLLGIAGYAGICLLLYWRQDALVFVPGRTLSATPATAGLPFEDLRLTTPDGETLGAWFVPAPAVHARPWTLLYCHGNAGDIGDRIEVLAALHAHGLAVLIFDYRGYGSSTGRPSEPGVYADTLTAWRHLVETRGIAPDRILVHGHSLGGAMAIWLAAQVQPGALWVESTFTSLPDLGAELYPLLPVRWLTRNRFNSLDTLARLQLPLLITHARRDEVIPLTHGRRLYAAAREPKQLTVFEGDHNTLAIESDPDYRRALLHWLDRLP